MHSSSRLIASATVLGIGIFFLAARSAESSGQSGALVRLQATTPGTAQTGHLNISGTGTFGGLSMPTGGADGKYLRSDASGNAAWANFPSSLPPSGAAGGDLAGNYPNPTLATLPTSLAKVSGGALFTNGSFVGVGTTSAVGSAGFVVSQQTGSFGGMYVNTSSAGQPFYGYSQNGIIAAYHYIDGADANKWKLVTSGITRMALQTDGKVGFGTTIPSARLDVAGSSTFAILRATNNSGSGFGFGGNSAAVFGDGGGPSSIGVAGYVGGSDSDGIQGAATGVRTNGVFGFTNGTDSGSSGVVGSAGGSAYAGTFFGKVQVTGLLSKGGGSFKIDHPLDPANKYLYHSFVESPDMMNVYNGTVTTDEKGYATVTMPNYFEALNRDFRYQLTVLDEGEGAWTMARVVRKMKDNRFTLQTSQPNVEVSWQVTGIRHDNFANANRIQVEVDKEPENKGKYLHPTEAGMPEEMGIGYAMRQRAPKPPKK